jgi:hypothetical protein
MAEKEPVIENELEGEEEIEEDEASEEAPEELLSDDPECDETQLLVVPNYDHRCNICSWSRNNLDLYNWTCQRALQGDPPGRIKTLLDAHITDNKLSVKCPSRKSVWTHFTKHLPPKEEVEVLAARKLRTHNEFDPLVSDKALREVLAGNFDEYKELCALYTKFREVNDKIYSMVGSLSMTRAGMSEWSQTKIQTYVSMVNTQKSILAEIGKMRQGDKLVSVVARFIVETFTKSIVSKLSEEFDTLAGIMRRQGVADDVLSAFEAVTHERLGHLIVEEAKEAMNQTKKEFKLPN